MKHFVLASLIILSTLQLSAFQRQPGRSNNFNLFSLKQEKEIGAESSREAEKTLPLVREGSINLYVRYVGDRLSRQGALPLFQYQFHVVNSMEVDSVAFPGGSIYVNLGLLKVAANEHELAAILAHEMAHAAARHGTVQLSRILQMQAPASIAAGLSVTDGWKDQLARLGVSLDAHPTFLRYNPDQELEADFAAIRMMSTAGYSPQGFASFIEKIDRTRESEDRATPAYVYSHPQSRERDKDLQLEIDKGAAGMPRPKPTEGFRIFKASLERVAPPSDIRRDVETRAVTELPNVYRHPQDYYRLSYPAAWQLSRSGTNGGIIAPANGVQSTLVRDNVIRGVMFDLFDVSERPMTLEQATNKLIVTLLQSNQSLRVVPGAQMQALVAAEPGLRTVMIGKSSIRDSTEVLWVVTRLYYQSLFYMVCVAPQDEFSADYQPIFEQMIRSVQVR